MTNAPKDAPPPHDAASDGAASAADRALVRSTAELARLAIDDDEIEPLALQFSRVLAAFRTLAELDVSGVAPFARPQGSGGSNEPGPSLRADQPSPSLPTEAALSNAPQPVDGFYAVPKTIGGDA